MNITQLDHLVLTVKNIAVTVDFYQRVLGMEKVIFAEDRVALRFGAQKINLHQINQKFQPNAMQATVGSADLCFLTELALDAAMAHVKACGVTIIEGPVQRTGAQSALMSFYIRDPDGNLIEIANTL